MDLKGASGYKMCPACQRICLHTTKPAKLGNNVRSTCLDASLFRPQTRETIRAIVDELQRLFDEVRAGRTTNAVLKRAEYHYGFNHTPLGLLSDEALCDDPRDALYFDWYHVFVISGLFQKDLQALCVYFIAAKVDAVGMAKRFISGWTWPRCVASPREMFSDLHINHDHLKLDGHTCTASYDVLAVFVLTTLMATGVCALQCEAYLKLCDCLDLILSSKYGVVGVAQLQTAIMVYLRAHVAAYGDRMWVPKHHYALHLARQLVIPGMLLGCNLHEIRHKMAKRWARDRFTQVSFESGCIEEITLQHLHDMKNDWLVEGLLDPTEPRAYLLASMREMFGAAATVLTAGKVRANCRQFCAGDYAFARVGGELVLVRMEFHVSIDTIARTCVALFTSAPGANDNEWCRTYKSADNAKMIASSALVASVTYLERGSSICAIIPAIVRMEMR